MECLGEEQVARGAAKKHAESRWRNNGKADEGRRLALRASAPHVERAPCPDRAGWDGPASEWGSVPMTAQHRAPCAVALRWD